mgnify:CR=1 FL=1
MQNRKGESPMENTNVLFDRKRLVRLIVPLIVEQVLAVTVGMADMVMVSGAGETAVSGISLVNTICVLLIVIFTSMASGGSVVGAQFLGSGDKKTACHAAEQLVMICGLIALVICGISFFGNRWILRVVYGSVEEQVMAYAVEYFFITSLSFPFLGIYNAGAALFRVMGNSNISMVTSIVMNALNIIGNAVFVFGFDMGVAGVALSTLISRAFASIVILVLLHQEKIRDPLYEMVPGRMGQGDDEKDLFHRCSAGTGKQYVPDRKAVDPEHDCRIWNSIDCSKCLCNDRGTACFYAGIGDGTCHDNRGWPVCRSGRL